jgi:hypothetical protein
MRRAPPRTRTLVLWAALIVVSFVAGMVACYLMLLILLT